MILPTVASRPPLLNQLSLPDAQRSNDCGETAVAMLLQAGGIPDTPMEEISDLNHDGATNTDELSKLLRDNGAEVTPIQGQWPVLLSAGDCYALVLIRDNQNADPDPNGAFRHYIAAYAIASSGGVQCVNPWGGRDVTYNRATLEAATVWVALVRWPAHQVSNQKPTTTGTAEGAVTEDAMNPRFVDNWNGAQHMFATGADGKLRHLWYGGASGWLSEEPFGGGFREFGHIEVSQDAGQLRIGTLKADGSIFRATQLANKGTWTTETH